MIDALIRIADIQVSGLYVAERNNGDSGPWARICDISEVGYYRDMMIIIRDRVRDMKKKGMTLEQVQAAKPTMDYDPLFRKAAPA